MDTFQITCKIHDNQERVVEVGINSKRYPITTIWNWIDSGTNAFFTMDTRGNKATVKARTSSTGRKYLTTNPDGITENNLDELPRCV